MHHGYRQMHDCDTVILSRGGEHRLSYATKREGATVARILVDAADPAILDLTAAALDDDGYDVLRADGSSATLAALQAEGYDILVTDDMFPRTDGILLIRYLRDYPGLALPIILLAPTRPIPLPPNTIHLATPMTIDSLNTMVADSLAQAHGKG